MTRAEKDLMDVGAGLGRRRSLVALAALAIATCGGQEAEEAGEPEIGAVVVTQWNDSTELFLEYPHVVAGTQTGNWAIHLTNMEDYQPIRSGALTVRFTPAGTGGAAETFTLDAPARDGIFLLDPVVPQPGTYQVELELQSPQVTSRHVLPELTVYPSLAEAPMAEEEEEAGGAIGFLKEQQWVIPFDVIPAMEREITATVSAPAEVVPPDGALMQVSAPVSGIAPAAANRSAPSVGQRVQAGQVLVVLAPSAEEGSFAESLSRVERLQREVARAERLWDAGAIAERRLEEARHDLEVALAELEAIGGSTTDGDYLLRLRAPISGVIARRDFVPGGRIAAGSTLFTVVNPSTAWLRVQLPVARAPDLADAPANFTLEGGDRVFQTERLLSVGSVIDPMSRTVPLLYEIGARGPLTFGQIGRAAVPTGSTVRGVAVPRAAVLDDNGTPVAYVQTGGESFERRTLTLGATDGAWTQVLRGIEPGEMVVAVGGYQVRLASLSGNEFAGGHAH